jgi:hypothetical protein
MGFLGVKWVYSQVAADGQVRWSGQVGCVQVGCGQVRFCQVIVRSGFVIVRSGHGQVNFEIRQTKYNLESFREIWNEIFCFQVAAIFKRFELGGSSWANSLCLLKLFPDINSFSKIIF